MHEIIEQRRAELRQICERFKVRTLEVFGSAADGGSDPQKSDIDFLVEFAPLQRGEHANAYFGLLEALEDLFARRVDLVMTRAIRNRYFLKSVNRTRTVLYAA